MSDTGLCTEYRTATARSEQLDLYLSILHIRESRILQSFGSDYVEADVLANE